MKKYVFNNNVKRLHKGHKIYIYVCMYVNLHLQKKTDETREIKEEENE